MRHPLPRPLMPPMPRHRVADSSCTAFVGDSRQRLRTPSEATVHQPALCGHKFGHCGVRCCGGSPASRGCGARHTQHPLSAPPSNPSFAAAAKCAWQHVLTTAGANYSLLLHPSPAAAAARLRARGLLVGSGAAKRGLELTVAYQSRRVACVGHRAAGRPYPVWDVRTGGDRCGCRCSTTCATSRCRCSAVGRSGSCCASRTVASAHARRVLQPAAGSDGHVTREREFLVSRQEKRILQRPTTRRLSSASLGLNTSLNTSDYDAGRPTTQHQRAENSPLMPKSTLCPAQIDS